MPFDKRLSNGPTLLLCDASALRLRKPMKKGLWLLCVLIIVVVPQSKAQTIYKDAIDLSELHLRDGDDVFDDHPHLSASSYVELLSKYVPVRGDSILDSAVIRHFQQNPFIVEFIGEAAASSIRGRRALQSFTSSFQSLTTNFSTVGDGVAQFLIQRAQTELAISLFRRFKEELDKQFELGMLFPQTHRILQTIDTEIYNVDSYVQAIRTAFRTDLRTSLENVERLLRSEPYDNKFKSPVLQALVIELLPAARLVVDGEHPASVVEQFSLALSARQDPSLGGIQNAFEVISLISSSLFDATQKSWISNPDLRSLFRGNAGKTFKIYLGLLYERGRDITAIQQAMYALNPETLDDILEGELPEIVRERVGSMRVDEPISLGALEGSLGIEVAAEVRNEAEEVQEDRTFQEVLLGFLNEDRIRELRAHVEDFIFNAKQVERAYAELRAIKADENQTPGFDDYFRVTQAATTLIRAGYAFKASLVGESLEDHDSDQLLRLLDVMSSVGLSIQQKNYTTIMVGITALLAEVILDDSIKPYRQKLMRYGALVAGLAQAESPEEVSRAFQASTLPPGSASIKKLNKRTFALTSYIGGFVGAERLRDVDRNPDKGTLGVTIPIGLSVSWGLSSEDKGAITIFASLIDLGAFGAFRLADSTFETLPAVELKNLFAPGGYLVYDFKRTPISIGVGVQFGPNVREFRREMAFDGTAIVRPASVNGYRISGFLAMDLPLLNLGTKYR